MENQATKYTWDRAGALSWMNSSSRTLSIGIVPWVSKKHGTELKAVGAIVRIKLQNDSEMFREFEALADRVCEKLSSGEWSESDFMGGVRSLSWFKETVQAVQTGEVQTTGQPALRRALLHAVVRSDVCSESDG